MKILIKCSHVFLDDRPYPSRAYKRDWLELLSSHCGFTFMYDVKGWLESFITPNISLWSYPPTATLSSWGGGGGPEGNALLFNKKWSTTREWSPQCGIQLLTGRPRGGPLLIEPNVDKMDLEKLEQDRPKYSLHFDKATKEWWN